MNFPITHEKILAFTADCADNVLQEIRKGLRASVCTDAQRIVSDLKSEIHDSVARNAKKTAYAIHLGNIHDVIMSFNKQDAFALLHREMLEPLLVNFPSATSRVGIAYDVYLIFTLPPEA